MKQMNYETIRIFAKPCSRLPRDDIIISLAMELFARNWYSRWSIHGNWRALITLQQFLSLVKTKLDQYGGETSSLHDNLSQ